MTDKERIIADIKNSLHSINEVAVYYVEDKELTNKICRELRKIHRRLDKLKKT